MNITNKHPEFFDMLCQHAGYFHAGALLLQNLLQDLDKAPETFTAMQQTEHAADELTMDMLKALNRIFITPIDREDLLQLSENLDVGVDRVHGTIERIHVYEVHKPPLIKDSLSMADLLVRATAELQLIMDNLRDIKKNQAALIESTYKIDQLEHDGDTIYRQDLSQLFKCDAAPLEIVKWKDILESLEQALDQTKHIANLIKGVEMKYA